LLLHPRERKEKEKERRISSDRRAERERGNRGLVMQATSEDHGTGLLHLTEEEKGERGGRTLEAAQG